MTYTSISDKRNDMQLTEAAKKKRRKAWSKCVEIGTDGIRWTQVSVNNRFGNSLPIEWTIAKLKSGEILPKELPLIRVAKFKGKYRSVDNRRLYCYKTAGIKRIPVVVIKENRKMKQLFEKNKSKNNGTSVFIVDVPLNPKNLDSKVVTYDPTGQRPSKSWTVRSAIQELEGELPGKPTPLAPVEPTPEGPMLVVEEPVPVIVDEPVIEPEPTPELIPMETAVEGEESVTGEMDLGTTVSVTSEADISFDTTTHAANLQKEGSDDTPKEGTPDA